MEPISGTYALVLQSKRRLHIRIGRWGTLPISPGYYVYVGSAFGPGGVRARVSRHCRSAKVKRWHIDYLRAFAQPVQVWCNYDADHLEHRWAAALAGMPDMTAVPGFGCTDCRCATHLFFTTAQPSPAAFSVAAGSTVHTCCCESSS
jgi:Uri superfamily endonuclease